MDTYDQMMMHHRQFRCGYEQSQMNGDFLPHNMRFDINNRKSWARVKQPGTTTSSYVHESAVKFEEMTDLKKKGVIR